MKLIQIFHPPVARALLIVCINFIFTLLLFPQDEECTIGVASGGATEDGRPLLWKTRDYISEPDNKIQFITDHDYSFIAVTNDGNSSLAWMGVNEYGLAIVNSNSKDLPDGSSSGPGNGTFMTMALGTCKTVNEMEALLNATNISGRTTNANYAVIDSTGEAVIFETGNTVYWRFDADDTDDGYLVRTNFSINGGGTAGMERYERSNELVSGFYSGDSLNFRSILRYQMRDFSDEQSQQVSIPYDGSWNGQQQGYIPTNLSICRYTSVSAGVIHGTFGSEPAGLATFWVILGNPATSIALPYWPTGEPPAEATGPYTADLGDIANIIKDQLFDLSSEETYINTFKLLDGKGEGLWTRLFPREDSIFSGVTSLMNEWRKTADVPAGEMIYTEDTLASSTYSFLVSSYNYLISGIISSAETINEYGNKPLWAIITPNPASDNAVLQYRLTEAAKVVIEVIGMDGSIAEKTVYSSMQPGKYSHTLFNRCRAPAGGVYIIRIKAGEYGCLLRLIRH